MRELMNALDYAVANANCQMHHLFVLIKMCSEKNHDENFTVDADLMFF